MKKIGYIPRGIPILNYKYFDEILSEIESYYRNRNVAFILIDPDMDFDDEKKNKKFKEALKKANWLVSGETFQPNQTSVIKISNNFDQIFASFRGKWRRNIKKAIRQGVVVEELQARVNRGNRRNHNLNNLDDTSNFEKIKEFYNVISFVSGRKKGFKIHPIEYFFDIWKYLSPEGLVKIFLARYKEKTVAVNLILLNSKNAYEIYGGSTEEGRDCEASYLLKWEILKKVALIGKRYYDQWGVAPLGVKSHPLSGISYFKSGFGGKYFQFLPQYAKVFDKLAFFGYKLLRKYKGLV